MGRIVLWTFALVDKAIEEESRALSATAPIRLARVVLSDVVFEFLVAVALAMFVWRRRPGVIALGTAGLCLGGATLTRNAGMLLVAVGIVVAIALHVRIRAIAAFLATFVLVVGAYVVGHHSSVGTYAITDTGSRYLYARLASSIVDCPTLKLPSLFKLSEVTRQAWIPVRTWRVVRVPMVAHPGLHLQRVISRRRPQ